MTASCDCVTQTLKAASGPPATKNATGAVARLDRLSVNSSRGSVAEIDPPGWNDLLARISSLYGRARGHLLARWFGGLAHNSQWSGNVVALFKFANDRMKEVESTVARLLTNGQYDAIWYRVTPVYGKNKYPDAIRMEVIGEASDGTLIDILHTRIDNVP